MAQTKGNAGRNAKAPQGSVRVIANPKIAPQKKARPGFFKSIAPNGFFAHGEIDKPFFLIVIVLLVFGIVMMFSASYVWALNEAGDGYYFVKNQLTAGLLGIVVMVIISCFDYHILQNPKIAYFIFLAVFALMAYTCAFGEEHHGARRWVRLLGLEFQPSEIMKCALIIIFAYIISVNSDKFKDWRYSILPFIIILGAIGLLMMLQRHFSGLLLMGIIGVSLVYVGGVPKKHFMTFGIIAGIGAVILIVYKVIVAGFGYFIDRFHSMLDPFADIQNGTWQTYQSLLAIGSGGLFGLGLGQSRQKFLYLSEAQNDFVFAIICEELGFVGAMLVILLFVLFVFRGFYVASKAPDKFGMLLVVGITIQIGVQAFLNIAVACNAFPNTGISLPFFSYGGTALAMQLAEMGIILAVSRHGETDG